MKREVNKFKGEMKAFLSRYFRCYALSVFFLLSVSSTDIAFSQIDTICAKKNWEQSLLLKSDNKQTEALVAATKAIDCWRTNPSLWTTRASIQNELKNFEDARKDLDTAFSYGAGNADYFRIKGQLEYETGNLKSAAISFSKAIELDPKDDYSYYLIVGCYGYLGKYREGIRYIDLAYQNFQPAPELLVRRAIYSFMIGNYEETIKNCNSYLKISQAEETTAHLYRGMAFVKNKNYKEGIEDLLISIKNNEFVNAFIYLGVAYRENSQPEKARQYFNKAIMLDSTNSNAYWEYAKMEYEITENADFALFLLKKYEKNLGEKKTDPKIDLYRAICFHSLGDTISMLYYFDRAITSDTLDEYQTRFYRLGFLLGGTEYTDVQLSDINYLIANNPYGAKEIPYLLSIKAYINFYSDNGPEMAKNLHASLNEISGQDKSSILYDLAIYELFYNQSRRKAKLINSYLDKSLQIEPSLNSYRLKIYVVLRYEKNPVKKVLAIIAQAEHAFRNDESTLLEITELKESIQKAAQTYPKGGMALDLSFPLYMFAIDDLTKILQEAIDFSSADIPPAVMRHTRDGSLIR